MKLVDQVRKLPLSSGVYFFLSKERKILYIGRATSLRRRVLSYFQKNLDSRLGEMLDLASMIKYKKTDSILESLILEANLIKKHWPKYNIKERDNRSFIYIVIPKTDYPYPILARERELKKFLPQGEIFGPYQSLSLVKAALKIIRRIFPYSTCKPLFGKPCFNHQIGLCPGLCIGEISKKEYKKNINNIILLFKGQKKRLLKKLQKEDPEKAMALQHIQDVALISKPEIENFVKRIEGYDVSHFSGKETVGSMVVFIRGRPDKSQYRLFKIKKAQAYNDLAALEEIIIRRFNHIEWPYPDLIVVDGGRPQVDYLSKTLKGLSLAIPLIGISKLARDKIVLPKNMKKSLKELARSMKGVILRVRNEAHRFALSFSRRKRKIIKIVKNN